MAKAQDDEEKTTRGFTTLKYCYEPIADYGDRLKGTTNDDDPEMRDSSSTTRYLQDIRWFNDYCEENDIKPFDLTKRGASKVGMALKEQYSGTTPRYRWDRIAAMYDWWYRMEDIDENPFAKLDSREDLGLTKSTNARANGEEEHACTEEEIRLMEQNVTRHRIRDQLLIRMLWQTGMRRGEGSYLKLEMIDRDAREITIPGDIAKNDKTRVVAYQQSLDHLLTEWLDSGMRDEMVQGKHDYVFSGERGGRLRGERINEIVREAAINAGINERVWRDANAKEPENEDEEPEDNRWKITAHNIRHGYGTYLVHETDAGLWEVSKQMGHHSVQFTEDTYVSDDPRAGIDHAHEYGPE